MLEHQKTKEQKRRFREPFTLEKKEMIYAQVLVKYFTMTKLPPTVIIKKYNTDLNGTKLLRESKVYIPKLWSQLRLQEYVEGATMLYKNHNWRPSCIEMEYHMMIKE